MDEKSYKNILVHNILYKILTDSKPLCIRFDKIDGFIRVYDWKRCLVLFGSKKYDSIKDMIILISVLLCNNQSRFIQFFTSRKNNDFL